MLFLGLLDYARRAHGMGSLSGVCVAIISEHIMSRYLSIVASPGPYPRRFLNLKKKCIFKIFRISGFFFFVFVNMGPYGSQNFKMLLLQITFESFHFFLLSGPQKSTVLDFWTLSLWFFTILTFFVSFSLTWNPMGAKTLKCYASLKSLLNFSQRFLIFFWVVLTKVLFYFLEILI